MNPQPLEPIRDCLHQVEAFRALLRCGNAWGSDDPGLCIDRDDVICLVRRTEVSPITAMILGPGYRPLTVTPLFAPDSAAPHEPNPRAISAEELRMEARLKQERERRLRRGKDEPERPPDGAHAAA